MTPTTEATRGGGDGQWWLGVYYKKPKQKIKLKNWLIEQIFQKKSVLLTKPEKNFGFWFGYSSSGLKIRLNDS